MKKLIINHLFHGLGIGFIATTVSLWIFKCYEASGMEVMLQFTGWLIASALYSLVSVIYDTSVPFPISFVIHFFSCAVITFFVTVATGLLALGQWKLWFVYCLPYFIIVYIIIGAVVGLTNHNDAKKINEKIKQK